MEFNSQIVTTPPRPAATIVMLRDGADGLEVFLLKRHGLSDVLGGVHVFPGGKVDLRDAELAPIPSVWGHRAGNPVAQPEDRAFIERHVKALLAG